MKTKSNIDEFKIQPKVNLETVDIHDLKQELLKRQTKAYSELEEQFESVTEMLRNINHIKYLNSIQLNEDDNYIGRFMDELKSLGVHRFNVWQSSSFGC